MGLSSLLAGGTSQHGKHRQFGYPGTHGLYCWGTASIRVGSGGVMLPNHSPLIVAEQFGTLASLFPDRIDLGLGRAPGTDQVTARALRRERVETVQDFPDDVQELLQYL